jgi:hypothetical protein
MVNTKLYATVLAAALLGLVITVQQQQNAYATGGAGEIKGLIDPIIERAITALQQNNTDLAIEEITNLKNELDDTFQADKGEENAEDKEEN